MKKTILIEKDVETMDTYMRLYNTLEEAQKAIEKEIASGILEEENGHYVGLGVEVHLVEAS